MPWSTSVGRKERYSSMLCISPLNSSMKALSLARTTAEEALAVGHAKQTSGTISMVSVLEKNRLWPI